ncbi:MAG: DUF2244 domain-containing protein [Rubrivivax sp.]|nr:DUF2244 domain-containing protein [Rubrivivax sp.]
MTATFVPSTWPAPRGAMHSPGGLAGAAAGACGLRFGQEVALSSGRGAARALQWQLRRNCSITPRQMLAAYALLCTLSLAVGLFFWFTGARVVLAFTGFELMLLGAAMVLFARHAGDRETLTLVGRSLLVERAIGPRVERAAFSVDWLTVEPAAGQNSLVQLVGQGHTMRVGRFLRPELRSDLARELRRAARHATRPDDTTPGGRAAAAGDAEEAGGPGDKN